MEGVRLNRLHLQKCEQPNAYLPFAGGSSDLPVLALYIAPRPGVVLEPSEIKIPELSSKMAVLHFFFRHVP